MKKDIKLLTDYYYTIYEAEDKEGKRMLTNQVNSAMESVPPKVLAMSIMALIRSDKGKAWDKDNLNKEN